MEATSEPKSSSPNYPTPHNGQRQGDVSVPEIPKTAVRVKRFRFNEGADIAVLKAVSSSNAHRAPWGKKGAHFEEAYGMFMSTVPAALLMD